ncbi:MAG TPA: hypothetical protein VMR74_11215 [Gammaproteobacteria bacterium]|nr:hypothetical protein [Gammaproteobacteria bacterium]
MSSPSRAPRPASRRAACAAAALAVMLCAVPAPAQPGGEHPDLNGIYFPAGFARRTPQELPYTPGAREMAEYWEANFRTEDEPGRFCIWPGMPRAVWGAPFPIEIFHRDHDISIYWEGYGMFRKIYLADKDPPPPVLETSMGYSLARWEGDTLVVETTQLKPYPYFSGLATTSEAHVMERIRLEEREVDGEAVTFIVNDITLTDPKMYTEPVMLHAEARRDPDLFMLEYTCTNTIWEEYLESRGLMVPDVESLPVP